ncbi:VWA domain-containing protein [Nocardioides campestrisoli]|uniref:VWA domain-containing protein n=1 Tax=Nocardioides campestrisoli TaxID=2736757 RepID=UPI00163D66B3|nr:VWA domain-containing protein [Nocardioides campestrisoli]
MGSGRHAHSKSQERSGLSPVLLVGILVLAVAGVSWVALGPGLGGTGAADADDCPQYTPVVISVVPAMELAAQRAVSELSDDDGCFPAEVRVESPAEVEDSFFNGGRPDLWIADTTARVERLSRIGISTTTLVPSLAVTPVGLAGGPTSERPESWLRALEADRLVLGDPKSDSASALALVAPRLEAELAGPEVQRAEAAVVTAAQSYGMRSAEGAAERAALDDISATYTRLIPATEQELLTRGAGVANLKILTPRTGAPRLTFPMVQAGTGSVDSGDVADRLAGWFASEKGIAALAESGLRTPDGAPIAGRGMGEVALLAEPPVEQFDAVLGAWGVLTVPSSLLAVFDASGSMDFPAGDGETRVDLAVDAALTALGVFPKHARIGMWAFSIDQGGPGQDWREIAPMRRLAETTRGTTHLEYLRKRIPVLKSITQGGTGLYDTTLAAYQKAVRAYDKSFFNAVILLSDGANDDPGSMSLEQLLKELEQAQDPDRPVRIISVGISTDADMPALTKISQATRGQAFLAEDPRDILDVFAQALMSR